MRMMFILMCRRGRRFSKTFGFAEKLIKMEKFN